MNDKTIKNNYHKSHESVKGYVYIIHELNAKDKEMDNEIKCPGCGIKLVFHGEQPKKPVCSKYPDCKKLLDKKENDS